MQKRVGNKSTKSIVPGFSLAKALMTLILNICDIRVLNSRCRIYLASCLEEVGKLSFREKKKGSSVDYCVNSTQNMLSKPIISNLNAEVIHLRQVIVHLCISDNVGQSLDTRTL